MVTPEQIIELFKALGIGGLAIYAFIKLLDFLKWFLSNQSETRKGMSESFAKVADVLKVVNRNQIEHDKQLNAIHDTQIVTADGIKRVYDVIDTGNKYTKVLTDTMIGFSHDSSEALAATRSLVMENSQRIGSELQARLDKLPREILKEFDPSLEQIRTDLSKFLDPDLATQIANALQPGLVALVERVLVDCLKQNTELVKELDKAEKIDDTATRAAMFSLADGAINRKQEIDKPDPEPPTPSGAIDPDTGEGKKVA